MQFLDALNILALLFYPQKKEEEKLSLKKNAQGGVIQKVVTDGQTKNKINQEFCFAVKLPKNHLNKDKNSDRR